MKKLITYLLVSIYNIFVLIFIYFFIYFAILDLLIIIFFNILIFSKFIFLYFIPVYFILSLYTIEHKSYYKVTFFGYSKKQLYLRIFKFLKLFNRVTYSYKYLLVVLLLSILWLSIYYKKIYFFIVILFLFLFHVLYYLYNSFSELKIYLEKYFLYFNCIFIVGLIHIFKAHDFDFNVGDCSDIDDINSNSFAGFIAEIGWPRWLYKNAFNHKDKFHKIPFSKKKELITLSRGLRFYNLFLEEKYLLNFKNYTNCNLNLDYKILKKIVYDNIKFNDSFIHKVKLGVATRFKDIHIVDNLNDSTKFGNALDYEAFYNKNLFNLTFNKQLNILSFEHEILKKKNALKPVLFRDKDAYAKHFLKELGLSRNLFVQVNLITSKYYKFINNYVGSSLSSKLLDENISLFLSDPSPYNSLNLNNLNVEGNLNAGDNLNVEGNLNAGDNLNVEDNLNAGNDEYYYDNSVLQNNTKKEYDGNYLDQKVKSIEFNDLIEHSWWGLSNNSISSLLCQFLKLLTVNGTVNAFDIYLYSNLYNFNRLNNDNKSDELNDFEDIECYIKYFNKYYRYFNEDNNIINWLNDLFIVILDTEKKEYNYWSEFTSFSDIENKDKFNLYKNFIDTYSFTYKKELDEVGPLSLYDDGSEDEGEDIYSSNDEGDDEDDDENNSLVDSLYIKEYYSETDISDEEFESFLDYDDVNDFYHRFFNYNSNFELFLNSYTALSLKDSNIKLEKFEILFNLNKLFNESKLKLDQYMVEKLKMTELNISKAKQLIKFKLEKLLIKEKLFWKYVWDKRKRDSVELKKESLFELLSIIKLNNFIKNTVLEDSPANRRVDYTFNLPDGIVAPWIYIEDNNFLFFEKYMDSNNKEANGSLSKANIFKNNIYFKELMKKPDAYKHFLFVGSYYNFIWDNDVVFEKALLGNSSKFINSIGDHLYKDVDWLFQKAIEINLNYYRMYIKNINALHKNIRDDLSKFDGLMYKESDHLVLRLQNMLRIAYDIRNKRLFDNEKLLLGKIKESEAEFIHFKGIMENFSEISRTYQDFCYDVADNYMGVNEANGKRYANTLFLSYDNVTDFLKDGSMDLKYFDKFVGEIDEIVDEFNKALKNTEDVMLLFDEKYVTADVEKFCVELLKYQDIITTRVGFWNIRGKFKTSTLKDADYLRLQIQNAVKASRGNDDYLMDNRSKIMKSLEGMFDIESYIMNDIKKLKKINEAISFRKQEDLNKLLGINKEGETNENLPLETEKLEEPKIKAKARSKAVESNNARWKRIMSFKSAAW